MGVLKEKDREKLATMFAGLDHDVTLVMFGQENDCRYCDAARSMLEDVAGLSENISFQYYDFVADADRAASYGVDKIPATMVLGEKDYGIRFYGVPSGYEFTVLIQDILDVGKGRHGLADDVVRELARIDRPVHLQVLISTT